MWGQQLVVCVLQHQFNLGYLSNFLIFIKMLLKDNFVLNDIVQYFETPVLDRLSVHGTEKVNFN